MKKIAIFAAIVIGLIVVIKVGGVLMNKVADNDNLNPTSVAEDIEDSTSEGKIVIEILNQTEETETESAMVESETEMEPQTQPQTEAIAQTSSRETTAAQETTTAPVYAVSSYDKTMYVIKGVNVRESYSTDSPIVSSLKAGQEVHATGEAANGWIQIDYGGGSAYVYKSYLSTSKADVETQATATTQATQTTQPPAPTQAPAATQPETSPTPGPDSSETPMIVPPPPIG